MPVAAASTLRRLSFDRLAAFPELFSAYCTDFDAVRDYYGAPFYEAEARRRAAERAAEHPRDREALADALLAQNEAWAPDDAVRRNIEALRDPEAVAVVTGQQVGLFGGPLYTPLKILTMLQLAERLGEETGRPVVPVFWLEGEDHDFEEVAGVQVLRRNEPVRLRYDDGAASTEDNRGPAGQRVLAEAIGDVLDALDAALPDTEFKPGLMEHVRAAYRPGATLLDAFARLLRRLFPESGLVFISPNDRRMKQLAAPLFRQEVEDPTASTGRVRERGETLKQRYHAQLHARPTNLFLLTEEGRLPLDLEKDDTFRLRGTDRTFTRDRLLTLLDEAPERFSPNVVLRPLMQDALLPTAAYVAGPGEVSYFAQLGPVYQWAGLPMPVLYPRASATLVEAKVQKVLDKYGLDVPDFEGDLDRLFQRVVVEAMEVDVEDSFREANRQIHQALNGLKPQVEQVDRTLGQTVEATRAALAKEIGQLQGRVVKAEKRGQSEVRAQLEKACANLFPDDTLQERAISALYFLNKYSPALLGELRRTLSLDTTAHQVVTL